MRKSYVRTSEIRRRASERTQAFFLTPEGLETKRKLSEKEKGKPNPNTSETLRAYYGSAKGLENREKKHELFKGYVLGQVPHLLFWWRKNLWRLKVIWNSIFN